MNSERLGVAVIGAGMAGRAHADAYRTASTLYGPGLPDIDLVAIADINEQVGSETARRFGYKRSETDWRRVTEADDIDVVSVVVANDLHREIVEALLAGGKHVLCEKPFAPTIEDAQAMVDAAARTDLQAGVGFSFRRSPAISAVQHEILEGSLGKPVHFNARYWCDYGADPNAPLSWRYKGRPGSGALADIGSHVIDTAEFLCGPIASISGAQLHTAYTERALPAGHTVGHSAAELSDVVEPVENEDFATFTVRFASGTVGSLSASRIAFGWPNSLGFEVFAQNGAASFDLARAGEFSYFEPGLKASTQGYRQVLIGPEHPYIAGGLAMDFPAVNYGQNDLFVFQARAFLEQVAGLHNLEPVPSFEHGLRNLRIMDAVVRSAQSGGAEVRVDK